MIFLCIQAFALAQEPLFPIPESQWKRPSPGVWTAEVSLETVPREPIFLWIKARAGNPAFLWPPFEIRLNESLVFGGSHRLSPDFWRFLRISVPSGALPPVSLRASTNMLKVAELKVEEALEIGDAYLADRHFVPACDLMTELEVGIPPDSALFPSPLDEAAAEPAFEIRGTKGWAWTPEQYLAEIPYLVKARMNFLMNCYTSLFSSLGPFVNAWWEPLPQAKKKGFEEVVRACRKNGIEFCFAVHPQLFSERPLALDSSEDFEKLWQHYAWMQSLGVTWFSVSYDDIGVEGLDKSVLGEAHARLVNKLLGRLREKTPQARMIFCPVYYWGCGDSPEASAYLGALGRVLNPDVYVFWTGDGVVTTRITMACAEVYRQIVGHRLIIWDNYPVNDRHPTLHLGPVTGRDPDLPRIADGYMSNPLCPQNEINRLPLFTCADYAWNPAAYDPLRSIGQAIGYVAETPAQRQALKNLVELYPGMLIYGDTKTSFNPVWERFELILKQPDSRIRAEAFVARLENAEKRLAAAFPDRYEETRKTIRGHIARMKQALL
jgi:hypothetical protein